MWYVIRGPRWGMSEYVAVVTEKNLARELNAMLSINVQPVEDEELATAMADVIRAKGKLNAIRRDLRAMYMQRIKGAAQAAYDAAKLREAHKELEARAKRQARSSAK